MDLVKILAKKSKTSLLNRSSHIEVDVMQNHEQKKKVKSQDFMGKTNYFLRTLPFSLWVVSATWLHVGAP
jgi:TRAP-type mannitol/chloroaromatic compound transport system permease small subunit